MIRTVVIGAGVSGLVRAHALARAGEEVLVLEASTRSGGVLRSERREGFLLEHGPNTVRPTPELWGLVGDLGLREEALLSDPRLPRYIEWNGSLNPLPMSPASLLGTRLLSPRGKLRLLAEPFARRGSDPEESVYAFFARRLGTEAAERFVEPFVGGIFAGSARSLAASQAFPILTRWEAEHGSLLRAAMVERGRKPRDPSLPRGLLSFRGGLETLPGALAGALGDRLETSTRVETLSPRDSGGWSLATATGERTAQQVTLAAPASEAARLVGPFAPEAARALAEIPEPFLAVLHLTFPLAAIGRPLHGFGHLVVPQEGRRILGAVWSSSLFPGRAPAGEALVTAFLGGSRDLEAAALSDEQLETIASRDVAEALQARHPARVLSTTRHAHSIPQYTRGHAERMQTLARAEAHWPGLRFLGNYRGGVSVGDVVKNALSSGR